MRTRTKAILAATGLAAIVLQATNQLIIPLSAHSPIDGPPYGSRIQEFYNDLTTSGLLEENLRDAIDVSKITPNFIPPHDEAKNMDVRDFLAYAAFLIHDGVFLGTKSNNTPVKQVEDEGPECQFYTENTYANFITLIELTNNQNLAHMVRGAGGKKQFKGEQNRYGHVWFEFYQDGKWIPFDLNNHIFEDSLKFWLDIYKIDQDKPWRLVGPKKAMIRRNDLEIASYETQYTFQITPQGNLVKNIHWLTVLKDASGLIGYAWNSQK